MLDDYSALREITPASMTEEARLYPMRHAYAFTPGGLAPAGAAGVLALDTPYPDPRDPAGLLRETMAAVADGFAGKLLIHGTQTAATGAITGTPPKNALHRVSSTTKPILTMRPLTSGRMVTVCTARTLPTACAVRLM